MNNAFFRTLNSEEEQEFRQWARENYIPGTKVNEVWHPVVREECEKMNVETSQEKTELIFTCTDCKKHFSVMLEGKIDDNELYEYSKITRCPYLECRGETILDDVIDI